MFRLPDANFLYGPLILLFFAAMACLPAPVWADASNTALHSHFIATNPPRTIDPFLFTDNKEQTLDLKGFRGKYVLLNLWATWCAPCVRELPSLDRMVTRIDAKKLAIVALNENSNSLITTQGFFQRHDIGHLGIYADNAGRAPSIFNVRGLPTTILIDPKGQEVGRIEGEISWDTDEALSFLKAQMP